jgi:hypothetical protein
MAHIDSSNPARTPRFAAHSAGGERGTRNQHVSISVRNQLKELVRIAYSNGVARMDWRDIDSALIIRRDDDGNMVVDRERDG